MSDVIKDMITATGIDEKVYELSTEILDGLKERFERIDRISFVNQIKVLKHFQMND